MLALLAIIWGGSFFFVEIALQEVPPLTITLHRVFWAVAIAILPIGLMYAGGIKEAQTATLVVSLPLTFTFWLSGWALLKSLHEDHPAR